MITEDQLIEIGRLGKPHGIKGEINASIDEDVDLSRLEKIALKIDGIYVPFFLSSIRPKRIETVILAIDGIDSEAAAAALTNLDIYAFKADGVREFPDDGEGMYAADLIGYTIVHADGHPVGKIIDINDSTENALFLVENESGATVYIPIADDLIDEIDPDRKMIIMTLPEGILDL